MDRTDIDLRFELRSDEDSPLFLDWAIDPKISNCCSGIRSVLRGSESSFSFRPADDGDFIFLVQRIGAEFLVQIAIPGRILPEGLVWPEGVEVKGAELSQFASELEAQLPKVEDQLKKTEGLSDKG